MDDVERKLTEITRKINDAAEHVEHNEFGSAKQSLEAGINISDCSVCKEEMGKAIARVDNTMEQCLMLSEQCEVVKADTVKELIDLKKDISDAI